MLDVRRILQELVGSARKDRVVVVLVAETLLVELDEAFEFRQVQQTTVIVFRSRSYEGVNIGVELDLAGYPIELEVLPRYFDQFCVVVWISRGKH